MPGPDSIRKWYFWEVWQSVQRYNWERKPWQVRESVRAFPICQSTFFWKETYPATYLKCLAEYISRGFSGRDEKGEKMTDEFYMRRAIELAKKGRALSGKGITKNVVSFMQNGTQSHPWQKAPREQQFMWRWSRAAIMGRPHRVRKRFWNRRSHGLWSDREIRIRKCPAKERRFCARQAFRWKRISCAKSVMR